MLLFIAINYFIYFIVIKLSKLIKLVVFYPLVFSGECICDFFHSQVGYELILGQLLTSNRIKVSNSLNNRTVLHKLTAMT